MDSAECARNRDGWLRLDIRTQSDVVCLPAKVTKLLASRCPPAEEAEVVTAILELATNALRYAGSGRLWLRIAGDSLVARCEDDGPGILAWDPKRRDPSERNDSLGLGLGIVSRLMDTVDIHTELGRGTRVAATRRLGIRTGPPPPVPVAKARGVP